MNEVVGVFINKIVLWIANISKGSTRKKDIFTCFVFIEFTIAIGLIIPLIQPFIYFLGQLIEKLIQMFDYGNNGKLPMLIGNNISFDLNLKYEIKFLVFVILTMFSSLLLRKAKTVTSILTYLIVQIVFSLFMFGDIWKFLFFLGALLFCFTIYIPFGSGSYFNVIKYASYIPNIYQPENSKEEKTNTVMSLKIFFGGAVFMLSLKLLMPSFTAYTLGLLFVSMMLMTWINNSKYKVQIILRKIFTYSLIVPFVLLNNNTFKSDIQSTVLVLVSIFFSIDRVVALFKELKEIIEENSLLFLLDEITDLEELWKSKIDFPESEQIEIPEQLLLRQIIIYLRLSLTDINKLITCYKDSGYTQELHLVCSIEYFTVIEEETSMEEREAMLIQIFNSKNGGIEFIPLLQEYARVLFYLEKGYDEIVQMLNGHWLYLSDKTKYILYYAYKQTKNIKAAERIKREMEDFDNIEAEMNEGREAV